MLYVEGFETGVDGSELEDDEHTDPFRMRLHMGAMGCGLDGSVDWMDAGWMGGCNVDSLHCFCLFTRGMQSCSKIRYVYADR